MTLDIAEMRVLFAAHSMRGMLAAAFSGSNEELALFAWDVADAMIAEHLRRRDGSDEPKGAA